MSRVLRASTVVPSTRNHHTQTRRLPTRALPSASSESSPTGVDLYGFEDFLLRTQSELCAALERVDGSGAAFCNDQWTRGSAADGYGITRVLEGGYVFEKAAANVSIIRGTLTAERARAMSSRGRAEIDPNGGQPYEACALSLVFHPRSPMVPTFRADVRRFRAGGKAWYGGGADLTPYYLFDDDAEEFHGKYKATCDTYDTAKDKSEVYAACKKWCDEYFYIPARKEHRGVGGVFFDDLENDAACDALGGARVNDAEAFTRAIADEWLDSYLPIVERRRDLAYSEAQ